MNWTNQILSAIKSVFGMDHEATEQEIHAKLTEVKTYEELTADIRATVEKEEAERFGGQIISIQNEKDALQTQLNDAVTALEQLQADVKQLTADAEQLRADLTAANAEVARLRKLPLANHAGGEAEPPAPATGRSWEKNPLTQKAQAIYAGTKKQ